MNFFLKNMLAEGELLCPIYRTECNSFLDRLDFHPHYEMYFCHGSLRQRMLINGREYSLSEPNIVILPPFAVHHISSHEPVEHFARYVVYFREDFLSQFGGAVLPRSLTQSCGGSLFRLTESDSEQVLRALQALYEENASSFERATALAMVLNRVDRLVPESDRMRLETMNEEIPRILEYIYRNVGADLNADVIANLFHISRAKLDRDFRRYVGRTVHQTVIDCRLSAAIDLLKNSDRSVAEVAAICGFESEYYFYSFFKRNTGTTPTAIRKQNGSLL